MKPLSLYQRALNYNRAFPLLWPLVVTVKDSNPFLYGVWFLGGARCSNFYGAYHNAYLDRVSLLFQDAVKPLHLFAGSLPASSSYLRVGLDPTGAYKYEVECNAEQLSSSMDVRKYAPDIIFADPPYSEEDMQHYKNEHLVNRPKVVSECAQVLQPGGFLIWLDQVLPVFANAEIRLVGLISYIRSTGNRFRCVCIFQKGNS